MEKKYVKHLSIALTAVMLLSVCAGGRAVMAAEAADEGGKHLNAAIYWSADTIDPAVDYDGWTSCRAGITETLVMVDENLELVPLLSDTWEQTDDTTWVMHIRDGVTFHNGNAVDAEAVKACFERTMSIQDRAVTACKIDSIEADGQDLTIHTTEPFGAFLANLSEPLYSVIDVTDPADPATSPVGTGPFMVTGYKAQDVIELAAYKDYWNGASAIDTVTLKTISDDNTRCLALQSGQIDIGQRINSTDIATLRSDPNYDVYETAGTRIRVLILNEKNEFLADENVRKALMYSLNYEALTAIMGDTYTMAGAPFPSSAPYGYDELDVQHYDADQAKACLEEAGFADSDGNGIVEKDGKELTLEVIYDDNSVTSAMEAAMAMAKESGINLVIKKVDATADFEPERDFTIMVRNWQSLSTGDPQWLLDTMYKTGAFNNLAGYSNPEMDALCDQLATAFDFESRRELAIEAEKLILEDCVNIMMFGQNNFIMASNKVSNVKPFPIDYYFLDNALTID